MGRAPFYAVDVGTIRDQASGASGTAAAAAPRQLKDREREAMKLRDKGWSYRRIADALQVQYILVSQWLSGIEKPLVRPRSVDADEDAGSTVNVVARVASADLRALAAKHEVLEQRIDALAADVDALKATVAGLTKPA